MCRSEAQFESFAASYIAAVATRAARKCRRLGVEGFRRTFGDLQDWNRAPVEVRRGVRTEVMLFAAHAAVATGRMWAHLSRIALIAGASPAALTPEQYAR